MKISAVIFDLDGTIADTIPLTVSAIKETVRQVSGIVLSDDEILMEFGPIDSEIIKKFVPNELREESVELYFKLFSENLHEPFKPIDGIEELLRFLKANGIKIGLFTGRSMRGAEIILDHLKFNDFFETIIAGDSIQNPKPHPEGIKLAFERLDVTPKESIYVGDFEADILASKAAGSISVLALWSSSGSEQSISLNPDKYFYSPSEFMEWINKER